MDVNVTASPDAVSNPSLMPRVKAGISIVRVDRRVPEKANSVLPDASGDVIQIDEKYCAKFPEKVAVSELAKIGSAKVKVKLYFVPASAASRSVTAAPVANLSFVGVAQRWPRYVPQN